jgi:hypothetical protein
MVGPWEMVFQTVFVVVVWLLYTVTPDTVDPVVDLPFLALILGVAYFQAMSGDLFYTATNVLASLAIFARFGRARFEKIVVHDDGEVIKVFDCVGVRTGPRETDLEVLHR